MNDRRWWAAKFKAFGIHLLLTGAVAGAAAWVVFTQWFPAPFAQLMGGTHLFVMVVVCDVVLGPVLSMVIYNPKKSRGQLRADYAVIVAVQLLALGYGLFTVAQVRPAFVAFNIDRYTVVSAGELPAQERVKSEQLQWHSQSFLGEIHTVYVDPNLPPELRFDLITSALGGGRDLHHVVENYRPLEQHVAQVVATAHSLDLLHSKFAARQADIDQAVLETGLPSSRLRWLPIQASQQFWTVLIDVQNALPVAWLDLDPL